MSIRELFFTSLAFVVVTFVVHVVTATAFHNPWLTGIMLIALFIEGFVLGNVGYEYWKERRS